MEAIMAIPLTIDQALVSAINLAMRCGMPAPGWNLSNASTDKTVNPNTATGKPPKYPVTVHFNAEEPHPTIKEYQRLGKRIDMEELNYWNKRGVDSMTAYFHMLPDDTVGKADIYFYHLRVQCAVHIRKTKDDYTAKVTFQGNEDKPQTYYDGSFDA
jgi:hypothetical protein